LTSFVSYSKDYDRVGALVMALRRHGLRLWRDQDSLQSGTATAQEIAAALEGSNSFLLWLSDTTLDSDYVWNVEVPQAFDAHKRRGLRIVPLFIDIGASDGSDVVRHKSGHEIGDHNGHVMTEDEDVAGFVERVARAEAAAWLSRRSADRRPVIRAVTRSDAAGRRDDADLNFDWIDEYPGDGQLPNDDTTAALQQALHASIGHVIQQFGPGIVELHLSCHLHIALALGFELRRVTGSIPNIAVGNEWWTCAPTPIDKASPLHRHVISGPASATRTAVEIGLSRDTGSHVAAYIAVNDVRYRQRIQLTPPGGVDQLAVTAMNVNPWAEQAAEAIRTARATTGVEAVDLFMAAPVGYAVALGWRLNAIGDVNLFQLEGNAGPYRQVWTLPPR